MCFPLWPAAGVRSFQAETFDAGTKSHTAGCKDGETCYISNDNDILVGVNRKT